MKLVDTHCHLDDPQFDQDREAVIERAREAGVERLLAIGTGEGPPDLEAAIRLAESYPFIDATAGVAPHHAARMDGAAYRRLEELAAHPKVVAVGEIGLEYFHDFAPRDRQREVFAGQLRIAAAAGKPVVVHTRDAWDDTYRILEEHWAPTGLGGIMHCFSGGPEEAERALLMGFHLSFAGVVTFPKATRVQEAARRAPLDRLLVETDAPWLAPAPKRGVRNEPAFLGHTLRKVAGLRGESIEELAEAVRQNYRRLCLRAAEGCG